MIKEGELLMITRSAHRRLVQRRLGAATLRHRRNASRARHLVKEAHRIEDARHEGKPIRKNGRFVGARAIYARVAKLLRGRPNHQFQPAAA